LANGAKRLQAPGNDCFWESRPGPFAVIYLYLEAYCSGDLGNSWFFCKIYMNFGKNKAISGNAMIIAIVVKIGIINGNMPLKMVLSGISGATLLMT
jgi:hypothetical protein